MPFHTKEPDDSASERKRRTYVPRDYCQRSRKELPDIELAAFQAGQLQALYQTGRFADDRGRVTFHFETIAKYAAAAGMSDMSVNRLMKGKKPDSLVECVPSFHVVFTGNPRERLFKDRDGKGYFFRIASRDWIRENYGQGTKGYMKVPVPPVTLRPGLLRLWNVLHWDGRKPVIKTTRGELAERVGGINLRYLRERLDALERHGLIEVRRSRNFLAITVKFQH